MRIAVVVALVTLAGCSHGPKKTTPELSELEGQKVALTGIESEDTARKVVEVALINQLVKNGSFVLVSKQDVETARAAPEQDPLDWKGLARRAGADWALRARVLEFNADTREGYSSETIHDSQLAKERGGDGKTERLYKVKSMTGKVRVQLDFAKADGTDERSGVAEFEDKVEAEARTGAAHLEPKLRFLEKVTNEAFREFFQKYN